VDNFNPGSTVITYPPVADSLRTGVGEPASMTARVAATLCAPLLDRQLIANAAYKPGSALAVHATRLTSARERQRLAAQLERLLEVADAWSSLVKRSPPTRAAGHRALWSSLIPLNWSGIDATSGLITQIIARLRGPDPVSARGVARVRRVLSSSAGPLNPNSRRDLNTDLRAALAAF
jgi:hypothetical protein